MWTNNIFFVFTFVVLFLSFASGERIEREVRNVELDELDRETIEKTGCKILILSKGENRTISSQDPSLQHLVTSFIRYDENLTKFEMHYAIRSDSRVVLTLSGKNERNPNVAPEYVITYNVNHVKTKFYDTYRMKVRESFAPNILSGDKYTNLKANFDDRYCFHGQECRPFLFYADYAPYRRKQITHFDFFAKNGAKILYDCPVDFAKCKCNNAAKTS